MRRPHAKNQNQKPTKEQYKKSYVENEVEGMRVRSQFWLWLVGPLLLATDKKADTWRGARSISHKSKYMLKLVPVMQ